MSMANGLLVNGPVEWYDNLHGRFKKYGGTWLAQNKELKPQYRRRFDDLIKTRGYFTCLGYAQRPVSKVKYRFEIDTYETHQNKTPPPDNSAPPLSTYDFDQGKCEPGEYAYNTWLHASHMMTISPRPTKDFTNLNNWRQIESVRGQPHYYIAVPAELDRQDVTHVVKSDLESLAFEEEHFEGKRTKRFSNYYERDPALRAKAVSIHGTVCSVCRFDFMAVYGQRGVGYIEVHHLKPVSELGGRTRVNPATDMTVLCANCHRMIHRRRNSTLTPSKLRGIIRDIIKGQG